MKPKLKLAQSPRRSGHPRRHPRRHPSTSSPDGHQKPRRWAHKTKSIRNLRHVAADSPGSQPEPLGVYKKSYRKKTGQLMRGISVPIRGAYKSGGIPKPPSPTCHWCSSIESRRVHFLVVLETHCLRQSSSMQQRAFTHATCQPFHFSNERPRTTRSHRYRSSSRREPARVSPNMIWILQRRRSMAAATRPGRRHRPVTP